VSKFLSPPKNANIVVSGLKITQNKKEPHGRKEEHQMHVVSPRALRRKNVKIQPLAGLPDVTLKKDENENGLISIDFEIQDILLLVKGISPDEVKFFNELPPVVKDKIKELGNVENEGLSEAIENLSRDEILSLYKVIKKYKKIKGV